MNTSALMGFIVICAAANAVASPETAYQKAYAHIAPNYRALRRAKNSLKAKDLIIRKYGLDERAATRANYLIWKIGNISASINRLDRRVLPDTQRGALVAALDNWKQTGEVAETVRELRTLVSRQDFARHPVLGELAEHILKDVNFDSDRSYTAEMVAEQTSKPFRNVPVAETSVELRHLLEARGVELGRVNPRSLNMSFDYFIESGDQGDRNQNSYVFFRRENLDEPERPAEFDVQRAKRYLHRESDEVLAILQRTARTDDQSEGPEAGLETAAEPRGISYDTVMKGLGEIFGEVSEHLYQRQQEESEYYHDPKVNTPWMNRLKSLLQEKVDGDVFDFESMFLQPTYKAGWPGFSIFVPFVDRFESFDEDTPWALIEVPVRSVSHDMFYYQNALHRSDEKAVPLLNQITEAVLAFHAEHPEHAEASRELAADYLKLHTSRDRTGYFVLADSGSSGLGAVDSVEERGYNKITLDLSSPLSWSTNFASPLARYPAALREAFFDLAGEDRLAASLAKRLVSVIEMFDPKKYGEGDLFWYHLDWSLIPERIRNKALAALDIAEPRVSEAWRAIDAGQQLAKQLPPERTKSDKFGR